MNRKCTECGLVNFRDASSCVRCGATLLESENIPLKSTFNKLKLLRRIGLCLLAVVVALIGFYASLILSADPLSTDEKAEVDAAIEILKQKGFTDEVFLLKRLAVYRGNDNWLNASVAKENAYAATNFPFEIVTLYPDFFVYSTDTTERAAILLHEAKHLEGKDEKEAFEFVWANRKRLGWTSEQYANSVIWRETRKLTKEYLPSLFVCEFNDYGDCSET